MRRAVVTGAGGFIGARLVARLLSLGWEVVALDNFVRGRAQRLEGLRGSLHVADLDVRNAELVLKALTGADAVFHLAAVNGTENFYTHPELVLDVGVRGILAVSEACATLSIPTLIVASSAEVYQTPQSIPTDETTPLVVPDPLNPRYSYGGSKIISELIAFNYCRNHVDRTMVFRPHNVYGPDMGWKHVIPQLIGKILQAAGDGGAVELQGDGSETRAFCYVEDIVDGLVLLLERGSDMNVYHIGTMEEVSILDLARRIAGVIGVHVTFNGSPRPEGGTERRCPDIGKMRRIGFEPHTALLDGIRQTVDWYRQNPMDSTNPLL